MINIPNQLLSEFKGRYDTHKVNIAACNIFFQTIRMLNGRHKYVDRKTYADNFLNMLSDIELVTPPTDAFIPTDGSVKELFTVNRLAAEYIEISKRISISLIEATFNPANDIVMMLKEDPNKLVIVHDDIFTYYSMYKYLDQIDMIRLNMFSNYTPIIEYIVKNISLDDWKSYLVSKKVNKEKYAEKCEDLLFNPDISATQKFYKNPVKETIPTLDVVNLIMRLISNIVLKTDIYIILGVYLILSFAMSDFNNDKIEDSPCATYVRDVLSKL